MDEGKPKWWSRPGPADPAGPPGDGHGGGAPDAGSDPGAGHATDRGPERRIPLHDPDRYSTPPYGEPGPWAPAPPVQHPGTTPAHGVPLQGPTTPADGTPAHGTPAHGVPGPAAPVTVPPQEGPGTLGHGTPLTDAPRYDRAPAPAGYDAAPPPYDTSPPPYDSAPPPHDMGPAGPAGGGGAEPGPWGRYDPWAQAPLQQTGAGPHGTGKPRARRGALVGVLVLGVVAGMIGGVVGANLESRRAVQVELPQAGTEAEGRAPDSVAGIAARSLPGVVTLHVRGGSDQGTGTGFVLDGRGHILTNNHVVEPAGSGGEISVTFSGGEVAAAEVVGRDAGYDLAVVKVSGVSGLKPLPLGNSDNVQVGDPVVAIGAPFDLANTVTSGIISAKERPITAGGEKGDGSDISYVDALQTDAPINPGNSGGPLMDSRARVIGINSAIRSAEGAGGPESGQSGSIGLGFAIPVNQGKRVAEELINTGKATHPIIGVTLDMDFTGDGARVGTEGNDGAPPVTVGGPGQKAGIRSGDVITEVDGQRVHSGEELIVKIRAHRPGDRLQLTLERGGQEKKVTLVLGSARSG
ncbi:S1C family serine protease [Streptomyces uncialis]|uniref:S1C family serine protease n=1 Tax=Streptomyces uncialis TaxID=1048205 RepID=UPI002250C5CD|nr:trypsin-like peptidase domain-containing protein [Streptomyces uncialis]MCX4660282.1 trypsin-like peptidase domain-containing protein [Streptomyces uncialis]